MKETCKPRRKSWGYRQDNPKEGREEGRRHDSKRGGMSNKERETDGGNCKTKRQDDKNKASKRDRNERKTWDETVKWRGWKDLEYKRRKHNQAVQRQQQEEEQ